uniref:Uncharacterized protein n=1 Tax=Panagrolaimus sp. ES5 TaxID=591445 RepID=A0AC34F8E6_9BILA
MCCGNIYRPSESDEEDLDLDHVFNPMAYESDGVPLEANEDEDDMLKAVMIFLELYTLYGCDFEDELYEDESEEEDVDDDDGYSKNIFTLDN